MAWKTCLYLISRALLRYGDWTGLNGALNRQGYHTQGGKVSACRTRGASGAVIVLDNEHSSGKLDNQKESAAVGKAKKQQGEQRSMPPHDIHDMMTILPIYAT